MYGRRHKKLNLLIEFSNSIFIKFCFKAYKNILRPDLRTKQISLLVFSYFQPFICPPDVKSKNFSGDLQSEPSECAKLCALRALVPYVPYVSCVPSCLAIPRAYSNLLNNNNNNNNNNSNNDNNINNNNNNNNSNNNNF